MTGPRRRRAFPRHGWIGAALIALAWPLNWGLEGLRTHLLFFPLWLGYVLMIDGLVAASAPPSLLQRGWGRFAGLFLASIPGWWLFEAINWRTRNWRYVGGESFSDLEYVVLASLSFSTVLPAVLETAELVRSRPWIERLVAGRALRVAPGSLVLAGSGLVMLAALLVWPRLFFPLVWVSLWCLLEPLNERLGFRSLLAPLRRGDWRAVASLAVGGLVCGLFWETWNWRSHPRWVYDVPGVDFLHVFEMPLAGYGGYPVFALELFALYQLAAGLTAGSDERWPRL